MEDFESLWRLHGCAVERYVRFRIDAIHDDNASEQYIDKNGRTILWRRFTPDDWRLEHCGSRRWFEMLPDSERLTINGRTFVHWYDCSTSCIL